MLASCATLKPRSVVAPLPFKLCIDSDFSGRTSILCYARTALLDNLLQKSPEIVIADARVKNFSHPHFFWKSKHQGQTFPDLGGFDAFTEVNIFSSGDLQGTEY